MKKNLFSLLLMLGFLRSLDRLSIRKNAEKSSEEIFSKGICNLSLIHIFNRCIETGNVLLILECWQDVHPALVSIPVKWEYSSP